MTLLNLRETIEKTATMRKNIEDKMDQSGRKGGFHPEEIDLWEGLGQADRADIKETVSAIPFYTFMNKMQEFLGTSSTTGISGAAYLIPIKISDVMFRSAWLADVTAQAYRMMETPGATLKVDYAVTGQYKPKRVGSGGGMPDETMEFSQLTITPVIWSINTRITNEIIEDAQWDTVGMHLEEAAKACAQESSAQSVAVLAAAGNGDGTINTLTTGATTITDFQDVMDAWAANASDGYLSDTIITHPYAIADFASDASVSAYGSGFHDRQVTDAPMVAGSFKGMNIVTLTGESGYGTNVLYSGSKWRTIVYDKQNAGVCVRKRWLKIENYSDPVKDLQGAVVSFREGYSTVNKDAICLVTEL